MPYFARLDENNIVTQVIAVSRKDIIDPHTGEEDEILGIAFCKKLVGGNWKQTSFNGNIRKRFASVGMIYNEDLNAFIDKQPYPSWVLDQEECIWKSPIGDIPQLTDSEREESKYYVWDEDVYQTDNTEGWVLVTPE
jgi:hypothetical protein